jgi:hypothetical protein
MQRLSDFFAQLYKALSSRNATDTRRVDTDNSLIAMSASDTRKEKETTMQSVLKSLVIAGVLASAGFATFAQTPGQGGTGSPMMGGPGAMHHGGTMGMRGAMDPAKMEAMMATRHAAMKAKLKLTPEQEGPWTTFTSAMKPPAAMGKNMPDRAELAKLSTPERIDKMRALRAEHMVEMEKREEAIKAFYAILHADQKQVFDAEHARFGRRQGRN